MMASGLATAGGVFVGAKAPEILPSYLITHQIGQLTIADICTIIGSIYVSVLLAIKIIDGIQTLVKYLKSRKKVNKDAARKTPTRSKISPITGE